MKLIAIIRDILAEMGALMSIAAFLSAIFVWALVADLHRHIH